MGVRDKSSLRFDRTWRRAGSGRLHDLDDVASHIHRLRHRPSAETYSPATRENFTDVHSVLGNDEAFPEDQVAFQFLHDLQNVGAVENEFSLLT